ncbi:lipoyl(octanoyl) transferase LipB [Magnetovibrio sp. PR-2]|uniref:lipoyl(octanoyl) transferase LipB n=1 Tax=Magnetovibrio sp. PR-2 TaxID=3120356 RepID=UPI002FCE25DB
MSQNNDLPSVLWRVTDDLQDYETAHDFMESRVQGIRDGSEGEIVWLLQHPPLYTAGTSADAGDLLDSERFPVFETGRGGQYTYHGPGQRVGYFMLDLKNHGSDVRAYVNKLEEVMIRTIAAFGVTGERREGRVGIWVERSNGREDKIGAIGVRVRKWVSFHGLALNVEPDLSHFGGIVPCGISEHGVTSLRDLGVKATMDEVDDVLRLTFETVFGRQTVVE